MAWAAATVAMAFVATVVSGEVATNLASDRLWPMLWLAGAVVLQGAFVTVVCKAGK